MLEKNNESNRLLAYAGITDGSLVDHVKIPHGGTRNPPSETPPDENDYFLCVDDPEGLDQIFSHIYLKNYLYIINEALRKSGYSSGDIDYLFMNQVKRSLTQNIMAGLGLDPVQDDDYDESSTGIWGLLIPCSLLPGHGKKGGCGRGISWCSREVLSGLRGRLRY